MNHGSKEKSISKAFVYASDSELKGQRSVLMKTWLNMANDKMIKLKCLTIINSLVCKNKDFKKTLSISFVIDVKG